MAIDEEDETTCSSGLNRGSETSQEPLPDGQPIKDANTVIGVGAGVGAVGVGSTIALGVTCPLCYIVAPGLIAAGLWKRRKALKK